MVMTTVEQHYPGAMEETAFVETTATTLAGIGFTPDNTLPVVAVCRDEICGSFTAAVQNKWGNFFALGGLAGLPFGGKTGMGAASHHAPDIYDRERFIVYAMAHIGFGPEGEVGGCVRPGMEHLSGACGALVAYTGQIADGSLETKVFSDDAEFGMLKHRMAKVIPEGKPDLLAVTSAALTAIREDVDALTANVLDAGKADFAVFTGTQIHLPDRHLVHASDSWVVLNGQRQAINFQPAAA